MIPYFVLGQEVRISDCLTIRELSEGVYMHSCKNNNGLIYFKDKEAIIISTPDSDLETQRLIDWVQMDHEIVAYIIDRWHPDAMEGLNQVHLNNIRTYSYEGTRAVAKEKNLPIPETGFNPILELKVGSSKVICHFLGKSHTSDGIVVWIPDEKVLFGGNGIRNIGGWVGNIGDANLREWSQTARNIKAEYGDAQIVVPGHGSPGGSELIDYTIELYDFDKDQKLDFKLKDEEPIISDQFDGFHFTATERKRSSEEYEYQNGKLFFNGKDRGIEIHADFFRYNLRERTLIVPLGYLKISSLNSLDGFHFKELYMNLRDDAVGYTIVIKEVIGSRP